MRVGIVCAISVQGAIGGLIEATVLPNYHDHAAEIRDALILTLIRKRSISLHILLAFDLVL